MKTNLLLRFSHPEDKMECQTRSLQITLRLPGNMCICPTRRLASACRLMRCSIRTAGAGYNLLVDAGYLKHLRINPSDDVFAIDGIHNQLHLKFPVICQTKLELVQVLYRQVFFICIRKNMNIACQNQSSKKFSTISEIRVENWDRCM